jgi:hypothetical protein
MFQSELSKIQDAETSIKKFTQSKIEELERQIKSKVAEIEDQLNRINKNLDKDFEQVDKEMQKLRQHILNVAFDKPSIHDQSTLSSPKSNHEVEVLRQELKETKGLVEFIKEDLKLKANIKDVCVLVDMKVNSEEMKLSLEEV